MIGIIFSNNLNTCPYIDKYLDVFNHLGISYEVILWDRDGSQSKYPQNYHVFNERQNVDLPKVRKILGFYNFMRFTYKNIISRKYDKLIFLTTQVALICFPLALASFKKKYIFDFRDLSLEYYGWYKIIVKQIIKNSFFTCMSSPEFARVLNCNTYVMAHNFRYKDINNRSKQITILNQRITLLHIGITRGEEYNKKLVDIFGGDERFYLYIIGRGNDTESFINLAKKYSNVVVQGTYNNEEKQLYISKSDLLLYYYPCDFNCNCALANKYYDCLIYNKPLVGNINTYSGRRIQERGLGISVDFNEDNCADKIFNFYNQYKKEDFIRNITKELSAVLEEDRIYLDKIKEFATL